MDETNELSNLFDVLDTYFSKRLITNFEKKPLSSKKNIKIDTAMIISEIFIPEIPFVQTSTNKFLKLFKTSIFFLFQF